MKELKFRAWDTENNRYFGNTDEAYRGNIEQLYLGFDGSLFIRTFDSFKHESTFPGRFIKEQYTGLHDSNGREIWEGDIIQVNKNINTVHSVLFEEGEAYLSGDSSGSWGGMQLFHINQWSDVIGNIHENKNLLEE